MQSNVDKMALFLQKRKCKRYVCKNTFKVLPLDKQEYCCLHCKDEDEGNGWRGASSKLGLFAKSESDDEGLS